MNYIPNIISSLRVLLIPVFVILLINTNYFLALKLFIIMGVSDALDGILARYLKCETLFGAYLDAIADKIMINISFCLLCMMNILPAYIFIIVLARDLIILSGIMINYKNGNKVLMNPIFISKLNTFLQIILVVFCLSFLNEMVNLTYMQDIINAIIITTIFSALEYVYNYKKNYTFKNIRYTTDI
ncbi:MAG: CDP-diacylglycerol--glycerol-3-phosphate 3-phosphatidyltransferase [Gammaproteobacteria bacterium]|nr:CDP-diacylglycerol--glycerol-3-phosphate 3-phosphatidyltransferase [Gammaproteobacteria bacterium]